VDFKTDSIRSADEREVLVSQYRRQMNRYKEAVAGLLGEQAQIRICFLDDDGRIGIVSM
jgi:ATP-dependent exoDNAse (exonuclease V) beta subunit